MFIGLESLNQKSLDRARKGFNRVARYREMQRRLHDHAISSMLGIVYGFDHDDERVFDDTMRFMDEVKADAEVKRAENDVKRAEAERDATEAKNEYKEKLRD